MEAKYKTGMLLVLKSNTVVNGSNTTWPMTLASKVRNSPGYVVSFGPKEHKFKMRYSLDRIRPLTDEEMAAHIAEILSE